MVTGVDSLTVFKAYRIEQKLDNIVVPVSVRGSSRTKNIVGTTFRIQN